MQGQQRPQDKPAVPYSAQTRSKDSTVKVLVPGVAAQIVGLNIAADLDYAHRQVLDVLNRFGVAVVRDQELTPAMQSAFAHKFGTLRVSGYNKDHNYAVPEQPDLCVVSNIVENGRNIGVMDAGLLWHTDGSYLAKPDAYTALYAVEVPQRDGVALGDTLFVGTATAYDALSESDKRSIAGLKAIHSFEAHIEKKRAHGNLKRPALSAEHKAAVPDMSHPIARTHPLTGRKCIFVTEGHTFWVENMPDPEGRELLEKLWAHLKKPEFLYRHRWRVGDFVMWDNCSTQHLATPDYGDLRRKLHRSAVAGSAPF